MLLTIEPAYILIKSSFLKLRVCYSVIRQYVADAGMSERKALFSPYTIVCMLSITMEADKPIVTTKTGLYIVNLEDSILA
jgi:hypothetical protein